jgi:hypothetical protein
VLYVFRVEESVRSKQLREEGREAFVQELREGRLRQGWGINGMGLLDDQGKPLSLEEWSKNFLKAARYWDPDQRTLKKAKTHHDLLSNMLDIREGDRLVVPNVAEKGRKGFVIATAIRIRGRRPGVAECYGFSSEVPQALDKDRKHYVAIDRFKAEWISYDVNAETRALKGLISDEGFWQRVRPVDGKKHPKLVQSINRISRQAPLASEPEPKRKRRLGKGGSPPSKTQQERGLNGEKEIIRRLSRSSGCLGLKFVEDHRSHGWGYDILCTDGEKQIELEVKTYEALTGQIFFTDREFRRSLEKKDRYHLWALLDDGRPASKWKLITLRAPYEELKRIGKKEKHVVYRISPSQVAWEDQSGAEKPQRRAVRKAGPKSGGAKNSLK